MRASEIYLIEVEAMMDDVMVPQTALNPLKKKLINNLLLFTTQKTTNKSYNISKTSWIIDKAFSWQDHIRWNERIDLTGYGCSLELYQKEFT